MVAFSFGRCAGQLEGRSSCDASGPLSVCAKERAPSCFVVKRSSHRCTRAPLTPRVPPDTIARALFDTPSLTPAPAASDPLPDPSHEQHGCESSGVGLGILRDTVRTLKEAKRYPEVTTLEKRQLHAAQRSITTYASLGHCTVTPIPHEPGVTMIVDRERGHFQGMQTCGCKICACCHGPIARAKTQEVENLLGEVERRGGEVMMATLTSSSVAYPSHKLLDLHHKTLTKVFKRRPLVRALEEAGYVGWVRGTEPQIDPLEERFHTHIHVALAFAQRVSDAQLDVIAGLIKSFWCDTIDQSGGFAVADQQVVERGQAKEAGAYGSKGVAKEIGQAAIKQGKRGSVSWYGLLRLIVEMDEAGNAYEHARLIALYRRFERMVHGARLHEISLKLARHVARVREEDPWQEEAAEVEEPCVPEREREGEARRIYVPYLVYNTLRQIGVAHVVPQLLAAHPELLEEFEHECAVEQGVAGERGYVVHASEELRRRLRVLFAPWCDR